MGLCPERPMWVARRTRADADRLLEVTSTYIRLVVATGLSNGFESERVAETGRNRRRVRIEMAVAFAPE